MNIRFSLLRCTFIQLRRRHCIFLSDCTLELDKAQTTDYRPVCSRILPEKACFPVGNACMQVGLKTPRLLTGESVSRIIQY